VFVLMVKYAQAVAATAGKEKREEKRRKELNRTEKARPGPNRKGQERKEGSSNFLNEIMHS